MESKGLPDFYFMFETEDCKYIFKNNKTIYLFFHKFDPRFASDKEIENRTDITGPNVRYLSKREIVKYKLLGYI